MAKCTGCGNELPTDAIFCPQCAQRVPSPVTGTLSGLQTIPGGATPNIAALAEGDVFHGRYTIERQLGAGAMGVVYAAKDQVSGRTVALKLINPALADRPSAREKFVREGLVARDIRHANIVAMYDVGEVDGQVYLVMEYLGGETLRKWLRRSLQEGRDISFDEACGVIREVLAGLAAAHATGVVHRDLKPENVILTGDPHAAEYGLKILDFGIARAVGTASHLTTTSSSTGTPLYMAPEQKTAAETVGPAADLYAVTAMLYELLIGVAPEGRWRAPSKERRDLPAGIDAVIETGLANRPRSRYQSAEEYLKALDAIGTVPVIEKVEVPEPPPPPPPPPPEPPEGRWSWLKAKSPIWELWNRLSRRQRWIWGTIGVLVTIAVVAQYMPKPRREQENSVVKAGSGAVQPPPGEKGNPETKPIEELKPQPPPEQPREPPRPAAPIPVAGRWFDEVSGTGVGIGYLDVGQQGDQIAGAIFNPYNYQVGTFTGHVDGRTFEYNYVAANGMTGSVKGTLAPDGNHLNIVAQDHMTGQTQRHTLHRGHLPHL